MTTSGDHGSRPTVGGARRDGAADPAGWVRGERRSSPQPPRLRRVVPTGPASGPSEPAGPEALARPPHPEPRTTVLSPLPTAVDPAADADPTGPVPAAPLPGRAPELPGRASERAPEESGSARRGRRARSGATRLGGSRAAERAVAAVSAVLGTLGIVLGVVLAGLHATRYDSASACAAYAAGHGGQTGFGCSPTARAVAVLLPLVGLPVVVVLALAVVWVPEHSLGRRANLLGVLAVLLAVAAGAAALAYAALPPSR